MSEALRDQRETDAQIPYVILNITLSMYLHLLMPDLRYRVRGDSV